MVSESDLHRRVLQHLLTPALGPQVTAVAVHLVRLQSGTCPRSDASKGVSLQALISHSRFSVKAVKEALQLLIHHGLATFQAARKDEDSVHTLYRISPLDVLMRMAVPRVLSYVADRFSEAHASLAREVFLKGRVEATSIGNRSVLDDLLGPGILAPVKDATQAGSPAKRAKQEVWLRLAYAPLALNLYRMVHFERRLQDRDLLPVLDKVLRAAAANSEFSAVTLKVNGGHLRALFQCMPWLVKRDHGTDAYAIDAKKLRSQLLFQTVHAYTMSRFSPASARLLAILQAHTLCEERTLAKYAMMPVKECRERLYQLLQAGIVRLQEVPRSADHAPSRTIFLWALVEETPLTKLHLHAIVNVAERAASERQKHALLLAKLARPDVQAAPSELLTETELAQIELMQRVQGRLLVQLDRILGEYVCCLSQ